MNYDTTQPYTPAQKLMMKEFNKSVVKKLCPIHVRRDLACPICKNAALERKASGRASKTYSAMMESPALKFQSDSYPANYHGRVPMRIKVAGEIHSEIPQLAIIRGKELFLEADKIYAAWTNSHGAVAAIVFHMGKVEKFGVKPGEFDVIEWFTDNPQIRISDFVTLQWQTIQQIATQAAIPFCRTSDLLLESARGYNIERAPIGGEICYRKFSK